MRSRIQFFTVVLSLSTMLVHSQSGAASENPLFRVWDGNRDGKLTKDELPVSLRESLMQRMDKDGNGVITIDEAQLDLPKPGQGKEVADPEVLLRKWDQDGDGLLKPLETPETFWRYFAKTDVNQDGFLNIREFSCLRITFTHNRLSGVSGASWAMALIDEAGKQQAMDILDRNTDGELQFSEMPMMTRRVQRPWYSVVFPLATYYSLTNNFKNYDRNSSGGLDEKERTPAFWCYFNVLDSNRNSFISGREIDRMLTIEVVEWLEGGKLFSRLDRDDDGVVSATETPEGMRSYVPRIDLDQDGRLTRSEFDDVRAGFNIRGELRKVRGHPYPNMVAPSQRAEVIAALDKNRDGLLAKSEMPPVADLCFYRLDTDDSGMLETNEFTTNLWRTLVWFDSDNSGLLEPEEFERLQALRPPARMYTGHELFEYRDKNKDGRWSMQEGRYIYTTFSELWDSNRNREIDADELHNLWWRFSTNGLSQGVFTFFHPPLKATEERRIMEVYDTDRDGALTKGELPAWMHGIFPIVDKDESGDVALDEFNQRFTGFFRYADVNRDGEVTVEELQQLRRISPKGKSQQGVLLFREMGKRISEGLSPEDFLHGKPDGFDRWDVDGSGDLSYREARYVRGMVNLDGLVIRLGSAYAIDEPSRKWLLDGLDIDRDGALSVNELPPGESWLSEVQRADRNSDLKLDAEERDQIFWQTISRFDSDLDRHLSPHELAVLKMICRRE